MVGSNSNEWPTIAEVKTSRPKRVPKLKIEGSRRTAPFKRKGITPYTKKGHQNPTLAKNKIPRIVVKKVEDCEGFITVVSRKRNGKMTEIPPGTSGEAGTEPIPTGAELPGTSGPVEATPIPTGDIRLPGTDGTVRTAPFPTGTIAGKERGVDESPSTSSYIPPPMQGDKDITKDLPEEEEKDDVTVVMSTGGEEELEKAKKNLGGHPVVTGKNVGLRERRKREAREKEEREVKARMERIYDPTIPVGQRWGRNLGWEEEIGRELSQAPIVDLQARVMEETMKIFKAANCSLNMKGSIVRTVKEAVAATRAIMMILARRSREREETSGPTERERYLEEQIEELKRRIEGMERSTPPPGTPTLGPKRKIASAKRRKVVIIESDEDAPAPSVSHIAFPPLPQVEVKPQRVRGDEKASYDSIRYCKGPSIGGKDRWVDAHPKELRPQDWAEFDALAKERTELVGKQNMLSLDATKVKESIAVQTQIAAVAARMNTLRMSDGKNRSHITPHTAPNQREEGGKVPPAREAESMEGVEITSSPVQNKAQKRKKKKKKKRRGDEGVEGSNPTGTGTLPAREKGNGPVRPTPSQNRPGSSRGPQRPAPGGKKTPTSANNTEEKHLPLARREGETYSNVLGRKAKAKGKVGGETVRGTPSPNTKPKGPNKGISPNQAQPRPTPSSSPSSPSQEGTRKKGKRKAPRTAAVVITCLPGEYKEVLREAVEKIDLASLNIGGMTTRKAVTGAQIYEIGGPDKEQKADALASRLRELVDKREGVRISRPTIMAELRICGLDESIVPADIMRAVARSGGCSPEDVKAGEVQTTGRGPGTAWIRCPVAAANKIVAARTIQVGWIKARVEALEKRPLQCFRCLKKGHTIAQCSGPDRSNLCYRCGRSGHTARDCRQQEHCPVCADLGRPAAHRAGTKLCASPRSGKKKGGPKKTPTLPPAQNLSQKGRNKGPEEGRAPPPSTTNSGKVETPKPQRPRRERENPPSQQPPEEGAASKMDID